MLLAKRKEKTPKTPKNVTPAAASHDIIKAASAFETSRIGEIEKSRTVAWRVSFVSWFITFMSIAAVMFLTPLKEVRPYVIRVDNNTGATDIVTMLTNKSEDYGDATAKYFSSLYVQLMEGYDWYTIQKQIDEAMMFSNNDIQGRIQQKFAMPDAPHKIYKDRMRATIKVTNTSIIDKKGLIQVRFTKTVEPVSGSTYSPQTGELSPKPVVTNHIATIGYDYVNVPTLDAVRLINPLGFTVKSYRVDDDMVNGANTATTPTPAAPTAPATQPAPMPTTAPQATVTQATTTTTGAH